MAFKNYRKETSERSDEANWAKKILIEKTGLFFDSIYNRENETYNFLKRNVHFSLFFHPIKTKAFNHRLTGN